MPTIFYWSFGFSVPACMMRNNRALFKDEKAEFRIPYSIFRITSRHSGMSRAGIQWL